MSKSTIKSLKLNQTQSHSSFESKTTNTNNEKKKKKKSFMEIALAVVKFIMTLPQFLNNEYYRNSFYSQWIDGLVILTQFGFMIVQIFFSRYYSFCQFFATVLLGFEMLCYSIYATYHACIIKKFSRNLYIDCMKNLIATGETEAFENEYNYRCDTFLKDCTSFYEKELKCPISIIEEKMENIHINRKMFLAQVIIIFALIIVFHIKVSNFLRLSDNMTFFKKLRNQNSMKWYHDVLLDKEKVINTMKKDINISLNQINSYIENEENNENTIYDNMMTREANIDNYNNDIIVENRQTTS
ncbi:hypothetical protein BCR32DRAFT_280741 [Anaeromyces robustus]|uniref:Uncharacterized protein n=1 Tax=Anaeromyces robustus TaxID=1754192 RepID=A0A1Y1X3F9_9FUNG|nr:hypothetical protein BCR32DRAFT_280741 [Anaeromyces robustus]|eukprot:ORX80205.1 hypothetical protein BCR32DRAFT_280741 [Anaeromyces robustus]